RRGPDDDQSMPQQLSWVDVDVGAYETSYPPALEEADELDAPAKEPRLAAGRVRPVERGVVRLHEPVAAEVVEALAGPRSSPPATCSPGYRRTPCCRHGAALTR